MIVATVAAVVVILLLLGLLAEHLPSPPASPPAGGQKQPEGQGKGPSDEWRAEVETSPMDGSITVMLGVAESEWTNVATLLRTNVSALSAPTLVLRCERHKTDVYVVTQEPASQESADDLFEHTVRLKFDGGKPVTQTWTESQDMSGLFAPSPISLAKRLAQAKSLNFEFTSFHQGTLVLHFNVTGLGKHLPLVESACGWK